jgi:hypothetical protein
MATQVQAIYALVVCNAGLIVKAHTASARDHVTDIRIGDNLLKRHPLLPAAHDLAWQNGRCTASFAWSKEVTCVITLEADRIYVHFETYARCEIGEQLFVQSLEFRAATTVHDFVDEFLNMIRLLIGYERVTFYEFSGPCDCLGRVTQDARKKGALSLLGVRRPNADIPSFARERLRTEAVRHVFDCKEEGMPLIATSPDWDVAEGSWCRATSACHRDYSSAMDVRSIFTMGVNVRGILVGLVITHNNTPRHVSFAKRVACKTLLDRLCARLSLEDVEDLWSNPALEALIQPVAPVCAIMEALAHTSVGPAPLNLTVSKDAVAETISSWYARIASGGLSRLNSPSSLCNVQRIIVDVVSFYRVLNPTLSFVVSNPMAELGNLFVASTPAQLMLMGILSCVGSYAGSGEVTICLFPDRRERSISIHVDLVAKDAESVHSRLRALSKVVGRNYSPLKLFELPNCDSALVTAASWAVRLGGSFRIEAVGTDTTSIVADIRARGRRHWPGRWATTLIADPACRAMVHRTLALLETMAREPEPLRSPTSECSSQRDDEASDDLVTFDAPATVHGHDGAHVCRLACGYGAVVSEDAVDQTLTMPLTFAKMQDIIARTQAKRERLEADFARVQQPRPV